MKDISKKIKQGIRDNKRSKRHSKVQNILEQFNGERSIASIKTRTKKILTTHMRNKPSNIEATRKGIANVFAKFYNDPYSRKNDERKETRRTAKQDLKTFVTMRESTRQQRNQSIRYQRS